MNKIKNLKPILFAVLVLALPIYVMAEDAAEAHVEHEIGIPFVVTLQAINFLIFFAIIFWVVRHPVKNYFTTREANFKQALVKAEEAKHEAEQRKRDIMNRLDELAQTSEQSVNDAKNEADMIRTKIMQEAAELSARLKEDARRTAEFEIERAKTSLRQEMLSQSLMQARTALSEKIPEGDQKRLQTEFVDKIQVVR